MFPSLSLSLPFLVDLAAACIGLAGRPTDTLFGDERPGVFFQGTAVIVAVAVAVAATRRKTVETAARTLHTSIPSPPPPSIRADIHMPHVMYSLLFFLVLFCAAATAAETTVPASLPPSRGLAVPQQHGMRILLDCESEV